MSPRLRARFERKAEEDLRMSRRQKDELAKLVGKGVRFDEPMSAHSSMGAGGPAEAFVEVGGMSELKKVIEWAGVENIDYMFWGGGTNILVRDGGIRGIVVKLGGEFDMLGVDRESNGDVYVVAGASTPTHKFVKWCQDGGFAGCESLAGVWGTLGGNVATNAGNNLGSISEIVEEITIVNRDLREITMKKTALKFEYRNLKIPGTAAIVRALLKLKKSSAEEVQKVLDECMQRRMATQPVGAKTLGCIFKNPGKTPAGVLIDEAGFKGVRVGGARVSPVHANFIVNEGNATARDITILISLIREKVREISGVGLETEIEIMGKERS